MPSLSNLSSISISPIKRVRFAKVPLQLDPMPIPSPCLNISLSPPLSPPPVCATCTVGPDTDPAYTDLRMDWGDTCSIGRNGNYKFFISGQRRIG